MRGSVQASESVPAFWWFVDSRCLVLTLNQSRQKGSGRKAKGSLARFAFAGTSYGSSLMSLHMFAPYPLALILKGQAEGFSTPSSFNCPRSTDIAGGRCSSPTGSGASSSVLPFAGSRPLLSVLLGRSAVLCAELTEISALQASFLCSLYSDFCF